MKFTIATIHSAYAFPFSPDGKDVARELSQGNGKYSVADLNWLKPSEDYNYNADIMLNKGVENLSNVSSSLALYFEEQFSDVDNPLLWIPSFHLNYLFYKNYFNKSILDVDNLLSEVIQRIGITEVEIVVFYLGEQSLKNLSQVFSKNIDEAPSKNIKLSFYELSENSALFGSLVKNYSLSMYEKVDSDSSNWKYLNESSVRAFETYGKELNPYENKSSS